MSSRVFFSPPYAARPRTQKKSPASSYSKMPGEYLATTYSHRAYRPTTIGAAAFHFRVRDGTGWFHCAVVTRGRASKSNGFETRPLRTPEVYPPPFFTVARSSPLPDIHMENYPIPSTAGIPSCFQSLLAPLKLQEFEI